MDEEGDAFGCFQGDGDCIPQGAVMEPSAQFAGEKPSVREGRTQRIAAVYELLHFVSDELRDLPAHTEVDWMDESHACKCLIVKSYLEQLRRSQTLCDRYDAHKSTAEFYEAVYNKKLSCTKMALWLHQLCACGNMRHIVVEKISPPHTPRPRCVHAANWRRFQWRCVQFSNVSLLDSGDTVRCRLLRMARLDHRERYKYTVEVGPSVKLVCDTRGELL